MFQINDDDDEKQFVIEKITKIYNKKLKKFKKMEEADQIITQIYCDNQHLLQENLKLRFKIEEQDKANESILNENLMLKFKIEEKDKEISKLRLKIKRRKSKFKKKSLELI